MLKLNFETRKGRERVNEAREGTEGRAQQKAIGTV